MLFCGDVSHICYIDFKMAEDGDIVEHFEILNNKTKIITKWTTLGTGKNEWVWAGAIKNKKGKILGISTSKNNALAIAMANGS